VYNKNTHAHQRVKTELGLTASPTVFWDGGYRKDVGGTSAQNEMARYNTSIIKCGNRNVADIDLSLDVTWLGAVNNDPEDGATDVSIDKVLSWATSEMEIDISVTNNEASQYNGHLHVYVCDINSTMGWYDTFNDPYTMAFLDYAFNQDIGITAGSTWDGSTNWDGEDHYDGHGHKFERIAEDNTMVIASVFDEDSDYSDETAGFRTGVGTDPKTFDFYFGDTTPPPKVFSNQSSLEYTPGTLEFSTTYYWKVDVWDALGNPTYGQIWNFTTEANLPPNTPSDPDPEDNATNITINTNLSWTGGDPDGDDVVYDVYLGTNQPPPRVADNLNDTVYELPFLLEFETKYYWKIVSTDEHGLSTSGQIWNFTTEANLPPNKASDPFPTNGANNVPVDALLNWNGSDPNPGDLLTYDVYFDKEYPPTTKRESNITENFWKPYPQMYEYRTYYWKIVTWDREELKTEGDEWSFSTGINNPPYGPEIDGTIKGKAGEDYEYTFVTEDQDGDNVSYFIYWGDGNNTGWLDYVPSGAEIKLKYNWSEKETYEIRARAKDIWGYLGNWSYYEVSIPKNKVFNFNFNLLEWLLERFPNAFPILRFLLNF